MLKEGTTSKASTPEIPPDGDGDDNRTYNGSHDHANDREAFHGKLREKARDVAPERLRSRTVIDASLVD